MSGSGRFSALRNRDFALLWSANVVSRMGTQMRDVALPWHVYLLTRSPVALGLLGAFKVVPVIALALGGGVAADAFDRRRILLATQTTLTALAAALALLTHLGITGTGASPGHSTATATALLYTIVSLNGIATAFDNPARASLIANLLPLGDLPNGLTLNIFGWQLASVIGPAIGGILVAATSVEAVYAVDAVSFLAVIAALLVIRPRPGGAPGSLPARVKAGVGLSAVGDAFRFLRTRPVLVWLMVVDFLATFFAGSMLLLPIFANEVFKVGARGLGWLSAAPAIGALAASAWLSYRRPLERYGVTVLAAIGAYGLAIAGFGAAHSFPLALFCLACSGAADTVSTVVRNVVRQTFVPDELRGRMNAINMIFFMGGPQLGEVEAGVVAQLTSARLSVMSGGVACVAMAAVVAAGAPILRRLRASQAP